MASSAVTEALQSAMGLAGMWDAGKYGRPSDNPPSALPHSIALLRIQEQRSVDELAEDVVAHLKNCSETDVDSPFVASYA